MTNSNILISNKEYFKGLIYIKMNYKFGSYKWNIVYESSINNCNLNTRVNNPLPKDNAKGLILSRQNNICLSDIQNSKKISKKTRIKAILKIL